MSERSIERLEGNEMTEHEWEVFKIVLDKGLLAVVVALFSWILARSLERLKASIAWNGELLRQRMDAAKRVLKGVGELKQLHIGVVGGRLIEGTGTDPRELLKAAHELEVLRVELSLLQADDKVLAALTTVVNVSLEALGERPPAAPVKLSPRIISSPDIPGDNAEWMKRRKDKLEGAIESFQYALAHGFTG